MTPAPRAFRIDPNRPRGLEKLALIVALGAIASMASFATAWELWGKLAEALKRDPIAWLGLVVLVVTAPLFAWFDRRWRERVRLFVDADGLRMRSAMPRWLQLGGAMSDWTLRWDDIARVAVLERFGVVHLVKRGALPRRYPLRITDWKLDVAPGEFEALPVDARLQSAPLWQALAAYGLFARTGDDPAPTPLTFDLAKHPATRAALVVLAALVLYAFADGLAAGEAWAAHGIDYYVPHAVVGAAAGALAALSLTRVRAPTRVPGQVAGVLAIFVALAAATASYFALIRVNQWVGGPLEARPYVRNGACDALLPVDSGLPAIEYTELARDYWCQFPVDRRHTVLIRRGLFGLYQVDLRPHTEAIRAFRAGRR